ncbi:unnamed protein product, partial [Allacma fusca]
VQVYSIFSIVPNFDNFSKKLRIKRRAVLNPVQQKILSWRTYWFGNFQQLPGQPLGTSGLQWLHQ